MNKFVKVLLVIAAVFASMGIGLTVGGAVMGASSENGDVVQEVKESFRNAFEFFYSDDWEEEWEEEVDNPENAQGEKNGDSQVYELAPAENLEIELRYDELILEEYTGTGILVEVKDDSKGDVLVREDGTTLKIISNRKLKKKGR